MHMQATRALKHALFPDLYAGPSRPAGEEPDGATPPPPLPVVRYECGCGGVAALAASAVSSPDGVAAVGSGGGGGGGWYALHELYYCVECRAARCPLCVAEEIDSHYCPHCLDNMTTYDASNILKNRCKKCFECPSCLTSLNFAQQAAKPTGGSAQPVAAAEEAQRMIYLHCPFCRWNSLELGLHADSPTSLVTSYIRRERTDPQQAQVNQIVEAYQNQAIEARLRARAKRLAVGSSAAHVHASSSGDSSQDRKLLHTQLPITVDDVEQIRRDKDMKLTAQGRRKPSPPPDDSSPEPAPAVDIDQVATLEQRFFDMALQPHLLSEIYPRRKHLLARISKRCRKCQKLLIKPDLIASKIEFKRQHVALDYVPRVTVGSFGPLTADAVHEVTLVITNPSKIQSLAHLSITPMPHNATSVTAEVVTPTTTIETFVGVENEIDPIWESPEYLSLRAKDEEQGGLVLARHLNKVHLRFTIKPFHTTGDVKFGLIMGVRYSTASGEQSFHMPVHINLGPVAAAGGAGAPSSLLSTSSEQQ